MKINRERQEGDEKIKLIDHKNHKEKSLPSFRFLGM